MTAAKNGESLAKLNVGLYFDLRNPEGSGQTFSRAYGAALELCEEADARGAHSVWFTEHHLFADGYLPQPLTFAAAAAARTRRARIGTAVLIAPFRTAPDIAEQSAVVDLISGGRLDLGLGAGYRVPEFELFGFDARRAIDALFERVSAVRSLLDDSTTTPAPVQSPLPMWVGCTRPVGARRVGFIGECLLSSDPALVPAYQDGLREGGWGVERGRMAGPVNLFLSDDPERDWPRVAPYLSYQWNSYRAAAVEGTENPEPRPIDAGRWRERGLAGGLHGLTITTAEEAAVRLRSYLTNTPIETIFTWAWLPGVPEALVARHVDLLCTVLPRLLLSPDSGS